MSTSPTAIEISTEKPSARVLTMMSAPNLSESISIQPDKGFNDRVTDSFQHQRIAPFDHSIQQVPVTRAPRNNNQQSNSFRSHSSNKPGRFCPARSSHIFAKG